jgi:predicted amidohydrolase YtcJ
VPECPAAESTEAPAQTPTAAAPDQPAVIFFDGQVITIDDDQPSAEAVAIQGNLIVAVGSDALVMPLAGPDTQMVDLDGRVLMPGFIDPHNHSILEPFRGRGGNWTPGWEDVTYEEVQDRLLAVGITTVGNPAAWPQYLNDFLPYVDANGLRLRVNLYLFYNTNCGVRLSPGWYRTYPFDTDPASMLRLLGVKFFTDGGSCMTPAFTKADGSDGGDLFLEADELAEGIESVQEAGLQAAIHAVGDRGLDVALDALEMALDGQPNTYRHRIEHNLIVRPDQVAPLRRDRRDPGPLRQDTDVSDRLQLLARPAGRSTRRPTRSVGALARHHRPKPRAGGDLALRRTAPGHSSP